jgi:hypothetical protein
MITLKGHHKWDCRELVGTKVSESTKVVRSTSAAKAAKAYPSMDAKLDYHPGRLSADCLGHRQYPNVHQGPSSPVVVSRSVKEQDIVASI